MEQQRGWHEYASCDGCRRIQERIGSEPGLVQDGQKRRRLRLLHAPAIARASLERTGGDPPLSSAARPLSTGSSRLHERRHHRRQRHRRQHGGGARHFAHQRRIR